MADTRVQDCSIKISNHCFRFKYRFHCLSRFWFKQDRLYSCLRATVMCNLLYPVIDFRSISITTVAQRLFRFSAIAAVERQLMGTTYTTASRPVHVNPFK